jgi:CubicO group peptidase (beta-lactamase class C family)
MATATQKRTRFVCSALSDEDDGLIEATRAYAQDALRVTRTPGLSLAVGRAGRLIWQEAIGMADLARGRAMTIDATWRAGSFSKTYVAVAVMQLAERGVIDLYAPVRSYLPELEILNPLGEREITAYDLLTFRSGLALDLADLGLEAVALDAHLAEAYRSGERPEYHHGLPRWTAKVGERYQYSNLGMATAGCLVERMNPDGLSFAGYVRERITQPLGLSSSAFPGSGAGARPPGELLERLSTGYAKFGPVMIPSPMLYAGASPAASLITTPGDQARLLLAFLGDGTLDGCTLVEPKTARMMLTPQTEIAELIPRPGWWNGLGFEMQRLGKRDFNFGHGGAHQWGWYSYCAAFPQLDVAVVVSTNCWEVPRFYNPPAEIATGLITDFIARWLCENRATRSRPRDAGTWAWRASYAIGLMMVERTCGLHGMSAPLDPQVVQRMEDEAFVLAGAAQDFWDAGGFRAGAHDACELDLTPASITAFLASGRAPITSDDLPLLGLWFGRKASLSLPMSFFATRADRTEG